MFFKKKIGLVLGGGGARGFSHIGVLKVLDKLRIKPNCIAGTSMGAVVGAAYCMGMSGEEIEERVKEFNILKNLDLTFPSRGLIKGDKLLKFFKEFFKDKKFEDLKIPLFVNAVDIKTGQEIIFSKGDIALAVRASISMPGILAPIKINGQDLIDGGVRNNLPVDIIKNKCKNIITSSAISKHLPKEGRPNKIILNNFQKLPKLSTTLIQTILIMQSNSLLISKAKENSDIFISPNLKGYNIFDFHKAKKIIQAGENEAKKNYKELKKLSKKGFFKN